MTKQRQKKIKETEEMIYSRQEPMPGFQFRIYHPMEKRKLWNAEFELLFVLRGKGRISYEDGVSYQIQREDVFAINGFQICFVDLEEDGLLLSLGMSADAISSLYLEFLKYKIDCRSFLYSKTQQEKFDVIRTDLARIFQEAYKNDAEPSFFAKSKMTALLEDLTRYFAEGEKIRHSKSGRERIQMASDYILQHYKEDLSLEDLADHLYLSRTYISRSFPDYFGISFLEYVTQVRLAHAVQDMHSSATLTEIAYNNGFSNENMMIRAFRKYKGMTPGEYRKLVVQKACEQKKEKEWEEESFSDSNRSLEDAFQTILKYAVLTEQDVEPEKECTCQVVASLGGRKSRIAGHWKRIINAGYARQVLDARIQEELEQAVREIGYEFIRIKGILNDDMYLLRRDMRGEIQVCYHYMDEVLDFILSTGAKPMVELGQVPELLADRQWSTTMRQAANAAPKDPEQWRTLIRGIMEHLKERYGVERMRNWIWVPWINADYVEICGIDRYMETFQISYQEIKRICPDFLTCFSYGLMPAGETMRLLNEKLQEFACVPEIYGVRSFGTVVPGEESENMNLIGNNDSFDLVVSRDPDYLKHHLEKVRREIKKEAQEEIPLLVDECSSNIWQRDLCNDTCYKAAWLFKNMLENENGVNGIAYFAINDRLDEVFPARDPFHGGFGMFTAEGIPKAVYGAARLLGKMGTRLVSSGKGYWISTDEREEQIQIFLYNYVHYDMLYRYRHTVNLSRTDRYRVFQTEENRVFSIQLQKIPEGDYQTKCYKITREQGSSYDRWAAMGAPEVLDREEKRWLCHSADPEYHIGRKTVGEEKILNIQERLKPHEVACIEIICLNHHQ